MNCSEKPQLLIFQKYMRADAENTEGGSLNMETSEIQSKILIIGKKYQ